MYPKSKLEINNNESEENISKISFIDKWPVLVYIFLIIAIPVLMIIIKFCSVNDFKGFAFCTIITSIYYILSVRFLISERKKSIKNSKNIHYLSPTVIIFLSYFYFSSLGKNFHNLFTFPTNLVNNEKLMLKMKNENPNSDIEILYNNDKYIFVKISDLYRNKSKIKILNFEKLTEE